MTKNSQFSRIDRKQSISSIELQMNTTTIITGDIIRSKRVKPIVWLPILEQTLSKISSRKGDWEIYRGDSFQLEISPAQVFEAFLYIRTAIKTVPLLDVRMAIGVGAKSYSGESILTSNGSAYTNSGEAFELLKKQTITIKTSSETLNEELNTTFALVAFIIDKWSANTARVALAALDNPELNQKELAKKLNKDNGLLSRQLKKSGLDEIRNTISCCTKNLSKNLPNEPVG